MSGPKQVISRTTPQLYRDCLRLVNHIAGKSAKGDSLRKIVSSEFKKNAHVTDQVMIDGLKTNAIRALSNYLVIESSLKDKQFKKRVDEFSQSEVESLKKNE